MNNIFKAYIISLKAIWRNDWKMYLAIYFGFAFFTLVASLLSGEGKFIDFLWIPLLASSGVTIPFIIIMVIFRAIMVACTKNLYMIEVNDRSNIYIQDRQPFKWSDSGKKFLIFSLIGLVIFCIFFASALP